MAEEINKDEPKKEPLVKVKVVCAALGEEGVTHEKGAVFHTTKSRAAALGDVVELVK